MNKLSNLFIPSNLQEKYSDVTDFMIKSGMIYKNSTGFYSYLPYGYMILNKIINLINKKLNEVGCLQIQLPLLIQENDLVISNRLNNFGNELFKTTDRNNNNFYLLPTAEEMFTKIVRDNCYSYKQLPLILYQIDKKFRDEIRPRQGIVRSKQFTMLDIYSFDLTKEDMDKTYDKIRGIFKDIFAIFDEYPNIVKADNGTMGGKDSEEFVVKLGDETELELGHIFKLETKYTDSFKCNVKDKNDKDVNLYMGCYGIGIDRLFYRIIEKSIIKPNKLNLKYKLLPYDLAIIPSNKKYIQKAIEIGLKIEKKSNSLINPLIIDTDTNFNNKITICESMGIGKQLIINRSVEEEIVQFKSNINDDFSIQTLDFIINNIVCYIY